MWVKQLLSFVNVRWAFRAWQATYSWPLRMICAPNGGWPAILMVMWPQSGSTMAEVGRGRGAFRSFSSVRLPNPACPFPVTGLSSDYPVRLLTEDIQYRLALCITHTSGGSDIQSPAFPPSLVGRCSHDYYGHSVALGLAPDRRSRVRPRRTSERDVGAPLISLNALIGHRSAPRRLHRPFHKASAGCDVGVRCHADGRYFASSGDWGSSNPAFAISRGSHRHLSPSTWT